MAGQASSVTPEAMVVVGKKKDSLWGHQSPAAGLRRVPQSSSDGTAHPTMNHLFSSLSPLSLVPLSHSAAFYQSLSPGLGHRFLFKDVQRERDDPVFTLWYTPRSQDYCWFDFMRRMNNGLHQPHNGTDLRKRMWEAESEGKKQAKWWRGGWNEFVGRDLLICLLIFTPRSCL